MRVHNAVSTAPDGSARLCPFCGGVVDPPRRPHVQKSFCSDSCRLNYWHQHRRTTAEVATEEVAGIIGAVVDLKRRLGALESQLRILFPSKSQRS